jgi:flavin-dependent dehydrogenase
MNNNFDVIISGCGPSGSILGYLLAQNNISTLILEKAIFPRKKICAGGIQHRTLKLIPFDVSEVIEKTIYGIYFSLANKDIIHKKNDSPIMYTVERSIFDGLLAGKANDSGCRIQYGDELTDYEVFDEYVEVHTGKSGYRAKILVGADGIRGAVHKKIIGNKKIHKIIGYEAEIGQDSENFMAKDPGGNAHDSFIVKDNSGNVHDFFTVKDRSGNVFDFKDSVRLDFNGVKKGYGWVFPKNNSMSCGVGAPAANASKAKKYFKLFLSEFYGKDVADKDVSDYSHDTATESAPNNALAPNNAPAPRNAPAPITPLSVQQGKPLSAYSSGLKILAHGIPVRKNDTPYCGRRVLAVGDAACFGDGFTGEGLYNAIKSSIIAADCIKNSLKNSDFTFSDYFRLIEADICRDIKISLMLTRVFYSSVFLFYNLLKKNDNYFYACCRILRGERSYKEIMEKLKFIKF